MIDRDHLAKEFGRLFLRIHRLLDRRMAQSGASLARAKILMLVAREGPARAADIAEIFNLAPRTVTEALDGLERDHLVLRTPDAKDRRAKRVTITDQGRAALATVEPLRLGLVEQIFGVLDEDECRALESILAKLAVPITDQEQRG
ncbi:MarR family winged helix-turn-helix transcriptional regulator [Sphingomonas sp. CJ20]